MFDQYLDQLREKQRQMLNGINLAVDSSKPKIYVMQEKQFKERPWQKLKFPISKAIHRLLKDGYFMDGKDDQEEINAALHELPKNPGGEVLVKEGDHSITAPIQIVRDNTTLSGVGRATNFTLASAANCHVIEDSGGPDDPFLKFFRVYGNKANNTGNIDGIILTNCARPKIHTLWIDECDRHGLNLASGSHSGYVYGLRSNVNDNYGLFAAAAYHCFSNCILDSNGDGGLRSYTDCLALANHVDGGGVCTNGIATANNLTILALNRVHNCTIGIEDNGGDDVVIIGNRITICTTGISVPNGDDVIIALNRIIATTPIDINNANAVRAMLFGNNWEGSTNDASIVAATNPRITSNLDTAGAWWGTGDNPA